MAEGEDEVEVELEGRLHRRRVAEHVAAVEADGGELHLLQREPVPHARPRPDPERDVRVRVPRPLLRRPRREPLRPELLRLRELRRVPRQHPRRQPHVRPLWEEVAGDLDGLGGLPGDERRDEVEAHGLLDDLVEVGEAGVELVGAGDAAARREPVDLPEEPLLHARVARHQVHHRRHRERRRLRPGDQVLVRQRPDVPVLQREAAVPAAAALSRVKQRRDEVQRRPVAGVAVTPPAGDDGVDAAAQAALVLVHLVVRRAGDTAEQPLARRLDARQEEAQDGGQRAGQVHLDELHGLLVLPQELLHVVVVVAVSVVAGGGVGRLPG
ncbi:hypothetical protein EE612_009843 [Oryza sativa]|nr:hypothetical protein EE612_009843 [Oryza sativa]